MLIDKITKNIYQQSLTISFHIEETTCTCLMTQFISVSK